MKCKKCGSENLIKDIDIYCANCGASYPGIDDLKSGDLKKHWQLPQKNWMPLPEHPEVE